MIKSIYLICLLGLCFHFTFGQIERTKEQVIPDFGDTYPITNPDIETNLNSQLKVIFDVSKSANKPDEINSYIVTAARFLNMHVEAGVPRENLKVALTIHGGAWKDILTNEAYKAAYGTDNPNSELLKQLNKAGVDIILCGQTAVYRNVDRSKMNPNVKLALSAMTALIQYQNMGYAFIKF